MKMNKTLLVGTTIAASSLGLLLTSKENRSHIHNWKEGLKTKITKLKKDDEKRNKSGQLNPQNIEDNKMVSEGARTAVQYFNRIKQGKL
jgi:uncharacterized protein (DUF3084 family)